MTKKTGINIRLDAFIEIDKTNFARQRDAFGVLAEIEATGKLPANFFDLAVIVDLTAKQGTADIAEPKTEPANETQQPDPNDPANWPLTAEPLPTDAVILEATTDLAGHIFQTIRLVDGTETFRRITAEQNQAEQDAAARLAEASGGKKK